MNTHNLGCYLLTCSCACLVKAEDIASNTVIVRGTRNQCHSKLDRGNPVSDPHHTAGKQGHTGQTAPVLVPLALAPGELALAQEELALAQEELALACHQHTLQCSCSHTPYTRPKDRWGTNRHRP